MYLLSKEGGRNLLEFMRNMTPQILFITTAVILYLIWRENGSIKTFLLFLLVTGVAAIAFIANFNNFFDNAFSSSTAIAEERDRLRATSLAHLSRLLKLLKFIWSETPATLFELVIAFCVLNAGAYVVAVTVGMSVLQIMRIGT